MEKRPLDILNGSLNEPVIVRLKNGREFRGSLKGYDVHLNMVLDKTEELNDNGVVKKLGMVVMRGDNVLFISPPPKERDEQ